MANDIGILQSQGKLRPYHGKIDATLEERLAYLRGVMITPNAPEATFDLSTADKAAVIEYISDEYGKTIDKRLPVERVREVALGIIAEQKANSMAAQQQQTKQAAAGLNVKKAA
jgi:hypothetical protein